MKISEQKCYKCGKQAEVEAAVLGDTREAQVIRPYCWEHYQELEKALMGGIRRSSFADHIPPGYTHVEYDLGPGHYPSDDNSK